MSCMANVLSSWKNSVKIRQHNSYTQSFLKICKHKIHNRQPNNSIHNHHQPFISNHTFQSIIIKGNNSLKDLNTLFKYHGIHHVMRISHHSNCTITNYEHREHKVSFESLMHIVKACVQVFRLYFTFKSYVSLKRLSLTSFFYLSFSLKCHLL